MTRWYKHGAVLAAWLGLSVAVHAQMETAIPSPVGAARMIEPLGYKPGPIPPLVPGPVTPEMAPLGPPDSLSLSAHHTSAFQCEHFTPECAFYASVGAQGLQRNPLPHMPMVFEQGSNIDTTTVPIGPTGFLPTVQSLSDVRPGARVGPRLTVGYMEGNEAVEFTGYYMASHQDSRTAIIQGQLLVPFNAPQGFPIGFEGNNGLWLNADQTRIFFNNQLANAELNYRTWNSGINGVELLFGLRFMNVQESVGIYTNDELFVTNIFGQFDPRRSATYTTTCRNNFATAQIGAEYSQPCPIHWLAWMWLTWEAKAAIGPNFVDRTFTLIRGDGLQGFRVTRSDINFGQIYEGGVYLDMHILDRVRVRAGWQALFLVGTSNAAAQFDFNLNTQGFRGMDYNTQFYHGPTLELQFLF